MSTIKDIYIIGSSGHAKVIIDLIESGLNYNIVGIIDDFKQSGDNLLGYKIIGNIEHFKKLCKKSKENINVVVAIGESKNRKLIIYKLKDIENIKYPILKHPNSYISKRSEIGEGTVILANVIVSTNTIIGKHCILNHNCTVDHDSIINKYTTICPNVSIAGNVTVGENSIIGLGSNIIEKVRVSYNNYIGAGSCIIKDTHANSLYFGCPAKRIRAINESDYFFS
ncbi:TPA: acetyltransferase [Providencia stuartii]|nr:acetyltransferase [Providencia stuartii]